MNGLIMGLTDSDIEVTTYWTFTSFEHYSTYNIEPILCIYQGWRILYPRFYIPREIKPSHSHISKQANHTRILRSTNWTGRNFRKGVFKE